MSNIYQIGTENQIFLAADISAIGPAASRASAIDPSGTSPDEPVAHSNDATGDIPLQDISTAVTLKNKRLIVFTKVALIGSDAESRSSEATSVKGTYTLNGGLDGLKTFPETSSDYLDPNVFLAFIVNLI